MLNEGLLTVTTSMQSLVYVDSLMQNKATIHESMPTLQHGALFLVVDPLAGKEGPATKKSLSKPVALKEVLCGICIP